MTKFFTLATTTALCLTYMPLSLQANQTTLYQYGTISALLAGDYREKVDLSTTKAHDNTFAIGAGVGLGEVVAINGVYYIADPHGQLKEMNKPSGFSFLTATDFKPNNSLNFSIKNKLSLEKLQEMIMSKVKSNQISYAILIKGQFKQILLRSEDYSKAQDLPLDIWLKQHENRYTLKDISGEMVTFFSPEYTKGFGVPGFHSHFVTDDKKTGGHVLNAEISKAQVEIMPIENINLRPGVVANYDHKKIDLDKLHDLENAELHTH
ncbi:MULTISPECIES: acetolactate decarboxylase [Cysteiniphilum]|uniref:acetolactate decarboxylase n=1 Tax=Cysteiniphilum TaxID=2056696 RepID=UPI0017805429|nr:MULTISPECIES: acetolactate decarboxylase [Cysteiniphilum]